MVFIILLLFLYDNDGVFTTADSSDIYTNPIFQTEDADSDNDYDVAPMSNYLDFDGTLDIGATDRAREDTYEIDDDCTVDYTSCFSNFTSTLDHVLRSGDTVTIGAGSYDPINLPDDLSGITLIGDGAVIDATGVAQGISAESLTDSTIEGFEMQNANTETFVYNMFSWAMNYSGINYNTLGPTSLFTYSPDCSQNIFIDSPYSDVTGLNGIGTSDLGLFLVHIPDGLEPGSDLDITAYLPNSIGSTPAEIETACGQPQSIFVTFVSNAFELNLDTTYDFNASALATAGITILGDGSEPFLDKVISKPAGIYLSNSTGNNISDLTFNNNEVDIYFASGSSDNTVTNTIFTANTNDIVTNSTGDNYVNTSTINQDSIVYNSSGDIIIDGESTNPASNDSGSSGGSGSRTKKRIAPVTADLTIPINPNSNPEKSALITTLAHLIATFTNLTLGDEGIQVLALQLFLNNNGFPIASSGPGSPGFETSYFGPLTEAALARFQASNNILPSLGYFGPKTKEFLKGF
jgi:hypothetical protein